MKKTAGFIIILSMLLSLLTPAALAADAAETAALPNVTFSDDYMYVDTDTVGWDACPVTVREDGAFADAGGAWIIPAAQSKSAEISRLDGAYPVTTHTFSDASFDYSVRLFADRVKDGATIAMHVRVTALNTSDSPASLPAGSPSLIATAKSENTASVAPGDEADADYIYRLYDLADAVPATDAELMAEGFDSAYAHMTSHWDALLSGTVSLSGVVKHGDLITALRRVYIGYAICRTGDGASVSAMGGTLFRDAPTVGADSLYPVASYLLSTGDTAFADALFAEMRDAASALCGSITPVAGYSGDSACSLIAGEGRSLSLETNLSALVELKSFIYTMSRISPLHPDDAEYSDALSMAQNSYNLLLSSVETIMKNTVSAALCAWEAADLEGSEEDGIFALRGESFQSAASLVRWYTESSAFTASGASRYLNSLAAEAMRFTDGADVGWDDAAFLMSTLVKEREDGVVVIGQGMPSSMLGASAASPLCVSGKRLSNTRTLSMTLSSDENTVSIRIDTASPVSVSVQIPAFVKNIEYSSCGFDSETGIISVPAGTAEITVRLTSAPSEIGATNAAVATLEREIALAGALSTEGMTAYSASLFETAKAEATDARSAPDSEKLSAADSLKAAREKLSPMTAGYEISIPSGDASRASGIYSGGSVYQLFTPEDGGTLSKISLALAAGSASGAEYTAVVYTLREDGFTPDKLMGEARGTSAGGEVSFETKIALSSESAYALYIESAFGAPLGLSVSEAGDGDGAMYVLDGARASYLSGACIDAQLTVVQADRSELDTFLAKCMATDTSSYTKESLNKFSSAMDDAKDALCSSIQSEENYDTVYGGLKDAYSALATYVSDDPVSDTPAALYVLLAIAAVLIVGGGAAAVIASRKRKDY